MPTIDVPLVLVGVTPSTESSWSSSTCVGTAAFSGSHSGGSNVILDFTIDASTLPEGATINSLTLNLVVTSVSEVVDPYAHTSEIRVTTSAGGSGQDTSPDITDPVTLTWSVGDFDGGTIEISNRYQLPE